MDKIYIRDLLVQAIIGVNKGERKKKQNLLVNLVLSTDVELCGRTDSIYHTINYATICKEVVQYIETSQHFTLEALSTGIARICCLDFGVERVIVTVDKPSALYLAKSPAVEIQRTRDFFLREENIKESPQNRISLPQAPPPQLASSPSHQQSLISPIEPSPRANSNHLVYLAIGSNLGDRLLNIHNALDSIGSFCTIEATSFLYETPAAYVLDQPSFLNAAVQVLTALSPQDLLESLKRVEEEVGREKSIRFGPRVIDLDIIFYDHLVLHVKEPRELIIPHERLVERDFVLGPLTDIAPDYVHPVVKRTVSKLFKHLKSAKLTRVLPMRNGMWPIGQKTFIMGVLNVTPDSFSDGGMYSTPESAAHAAIEMEKDGADIIDVGGQSTRPGAELVNCEEELKRVIPVVQAIREKSSIPISVDTFYAEVAKQSLEAGADIVNDTTGGTFDCEIFNVCAKYRCPMVLMHNRGNPKSMTTLAVYKDVMREVKDVLEERVQVATSKGLRRWQIILDPGIGFAKKKEHSLELLRSGRDLKAMDFPLLYGTSRKGFIGEITGQKDPTKRAFGTAATCTVAIQQGADILRVHDVKEMKDVVLMSDAIYRTASSLPPIK